MSEVLQLLHLRCAPVPDAASTQLEEHRREEVYALWQGIFERALPVPVEPAVEGGELERSAASAAVTHASTVSSAPTAAVSVCVSGATVRIVVRDGHLSEEEALRTAFETAGDLAGTRAALQQLTLNGQVLYHHDGGDTGRSAAALMFA